MQKFSLRTKAINPTSFTRVGGQITRHVRLAKTQKLNPNFFTGFADGESSFIVTIFKEKAYKLG
jgi:hypothetical protein